MDPYVAPQLDDRETNSESESPPVAAVNATELEALPQPRAAREAETGLAADRLWAARPFDHGGPVQVDPTGCGSPADGAA